MVLRCPFVADDVPVGAFLASINLQILHKFLSRSTPGSSPMEVSITQGSAALHGRGAAGVSGPCRPEGP